MSKEVSISQGQNSAIDAKVTAVIVTYQADFEPLLENIKQLYAQVEHIVVVDNGSGNQEALQKKLKAKRSFSGKLSLVCLDDNKGLGFAHNQGIYKAKEFASDYVLLLDQDSCPEANMVGNLLTASESLSAEAQKSGYLNALAAVGPSYVGEGNEESFFIRFGDFRFQRSYCSANSDGIIIADFLISSGSLFPMQALDEIGLMDEDLFIDHVDTEWFLRAKYKGYQSYGVCNALMHHGLGERTHKVKLFGLGRERNVPQHKPFRYYYMFRNSIALYKRGYSRKWMCNDMLRLVQIFAFYGICYGPRLKNLSMMLKGIKDGVFGNLGRAKF